MLVSFSVSNYRSFLEEVTLNMVASNKLTDHKNHLLPIGETGKHLVRSALIYGANASGKSNLIQAMEVAQSRVVWRGQKVWLPIDPFRFQPEDDKRPSSFEFRFLIEERVFTYGFDTTDERIVAEWLTLRKGDDDQVIFERDADGKTTTGNAVNQLSRSDPRLKKTLDILTQLPLRHHQLFLNHVRSLPDETQGSTLNAILRWFTEDFKVIEANHRSGELLDRLDRDEEFRQFCEEFLNKVDTGIGGLRFEETEVELDEQQRERFRPYDIGDGETEYRLPQFGTNTDLRLKRDDPSRAIRRTLLAEHPTPEKTYQLPFHEESLGTQQLLHFMPILFTSAGENKIVVIDELDTSLHPMICWELLRYFSEQCSGAQTQLIVTTHESHLLDQELLRRDEYWFVEKDEKQQSQLFSLSDFNVRNDLQIRKGYLDGRFGGVPWFGTMDERHHLSDLETGEGADATEKTST